MDYKLFSVSRPKFFDIMTKFSFIGDRLVSAGSFYIDAKLTQEEADKINTVFPNSVREITFNWSNVG
jgi:hypothetical protein